MKVEELMIGDLVKYKSKSGKIINIDTDDIFDNTATIDTKNSIDYDLDIKELKPIPITPQILEKNGFKKRKYESMFCNNEQTEYINKDKTIIINGLSNTTGKDWNCHIDNDDMETIGCADIQYVHELQHLLRLCNIDKEIKL